MNDGSERSDRVDSYASPMSRRSPDASNGGQSPKLGITGECESPMPRERRRKQPISRINADLPREPGDIEIPQQA